MIGCHDHFVFPGPCIGLIGKTHFTPPRVPLVEKPKRSFRRISVQRRLCVDEDAAVQTGASQSLAFVLQNGLLALCWSRISWDASVRQDLINDVPQDWLPGRQLVWAKRLVVIEKRTKKSESLNRPLTRMMYGGFRCDKLDTVPGSAKRIFLFERVVQGRSKSGSCARQRSLTVCQGWVTAAVLHEVQPPLVKPA